MNFGRRLVENGVPQPQVMARDMMVSQNLYADLLLVLNEEILLYLLHRAKNTDKIIFLESQFI
jgi:hypothetical protein